LDICKISATNNHKIYLLGSSSSVIQKSIVRATREFPGIKIEGSEGPKLNNNATPVTKRDRLIEKDIILKIKKYNPDILFVAFGAPKQEKWIEKQKGSLPASLYMGVGGTLDYYAQVKPLPPEWMEKWGLEWLWRVINEPQRIGRIINAVFIFPILILLYSFTKEK
jgi:N-acetylglucosaminyldiphosphoundecaprenol N-acetyl-beta-D-mannosaminyltransferase